MLIRALQETFENLLGSESYQRNSDEMLTKFTTSNYAENPIFHLMSRIRLAHTGVSMGNWNTMDVHLRS